MQVSQSTIDSLRLLEHRSDANLHIPPWATKRAAGLEVGAQLPTRDGRKTGNAHIVRITPAPRGRIGLHYLILTDGGNSFVMTEPEIEAQYYPPEFVGNLSQIIKKFWREDTPLLSELTDPVT